MPDIYGKSKSLDPNIQPEKQNIKPLKGNEISHERPWIGQGRAGIRIRRPPPINQSITQTSELSKKIPEAPKNRIENNKPTRFCSPLNNQ